LGDEQWIEAFALLRGEEADGGAVEQASSPCQWGMPPEGFAARVSIVKTQRAANALRAAARARIQVDGRVGC
jgi:hypothetical protein